ncbi:MAG: hypothetical protein K9L17_02780 [Clostridiales bacterium]|nr:hypothetical protein [Clostridiales bacterium]MCF8021605.1 hypothetical protein [Clostridiales bacterium]
MDFSSDAVWLVNAPANNHKTYDYNFLNDKRKIVTCDEATYLSFKTVGKKTSFTMHPCKASKDKIILHPGSSYETIFDKSAD